MNRKSGLILTLMLALVLSACKTKPDTAAVPDESGQIPQTDSSAGVFGTQYTAQELLDRFGIDGDPLQYKVLYFEYNSSALDERSRIIATRHAQHLGESGGARVNLDGHADERGTRDYNLALGERRAQAVADWMNSEGARSTIQTISYGEERPVATGHDEESWRQNRRVEIKY